MGRYDLAMEYRVLKIGRWIVKFLFAVDKYEIGKTLALLDSMEASKEILERTREIMESGHMNTGFTFTNPSIFRAAVVVGPSTSGKEFVNTLVHEIHHLAVAIASELGIDLESETPAYIAGDSVLELADLICELGCDKCSEDKA